MTRNNIAASILFIREGITRKSSYGIKSGLLTLLILTHSISAYSQPTEESIYQAQRMYIAYFGRPGLPNGLEYWANRFDEGGNAQTIAEAFGSSAEYFNKYAQTPNWELVYFLYRQMFSRDPESAGHAYFRDLLNTESVSTESIAIEIADAAVNEDFLALENKIFVANEFSSLIPIDGDEYIDLQGITELLATVNSDPETVDEALDQLTDFILDASFNPGYRNLLIKGRAPADDEPDDTDIISVNRGKNIEVIRTQAQFEQAVAESTWGEYKTPYVDFQNKIVLRYGLGIRPNGGWSAQVTSIVNLEDAIRVNIEINVACVAVQVFTSPGYFIEIDRFIDDDDDYPRPKEILVNETMATCEL